MANKEIKKASVELYELQVVDIDAVADSDADDTIIEKILSKRNSGYVRAVRKGLTVTVAKGNEIMEISSDKTSRRVGKIGMEDVKIPTAPIQIQ